MGWRQRRQGPRLRPPSIHVCPFQLSASGDGKQIGGTDAISCCRAQRADAPSPNRFSCYQLTGGGGGEVTAAAPGVKGRRSYTFTVALDTRAELKCLIHLDTDTLQHVHTWVKLKISSWIITLVKVKFSLNTTGVKVLVRGSKSFYVSDACILWMLCNWSLKELSTLIESSLLLLGWWSSNKHPKWNLQYFYG